MLNLFNCQIRAKSALISGIRNRSLASLASGWDTLTQKTTTRKIMKKMHLSSTMALACVIISGCASIVDGGPSTVRINSSPSGAKFTIADKSGKVIETRTTPASVSLKRAHGFFSGEDYKVAFEFPGYYPGEAHIRATLNGWYFGNLIFGGVLGILIIDPATGAMWTLAPDDL